MEPVASNSEREERIENEIVVDAYGPEERAMSWYYYLQNTLRFPFRATCIAVRITSPLRLGQEVDVVGMAPEDACEHEMLMVIRWNHDSLGVPLSQLSGVSVDEETQQGIEDWHYWIARGYLF